VREVTTSLDDEIHEDHDMVESQEPPQMTISHKKYCAPEGTMRQIKKPNPFSSYMDLMCDLIEKEPTFFEKNIQKK
jgi:hypothetical protein